MDDPFTIVFDPGRMIFSLLHQLNELHKKAKSFCWCFIFLVPIIPSSAYSFDYAKEHMPNDVKTFEWARRHFTRLLDVHWKNINSDVSDLQDNSLTCSLLGWHTTICIGLPSFPNDTVHRRLVMNSGEAVEYKGSLVYFI
ncbi:hypothetical protein HAX54_025171 [Datura stramonium]|uniref:ADP/ATP translocase n=1 Tax=Datura stramonium TaxID=4076 RepID=A0ABS8Y5R2_DATST|nr:hypothetical protein [Datura stramonium]